ncbi:hypothetical protein GGI21_003975, partial [Coemansia aciculifera]
MVSGLHKRGRQQSRVLSGWRFPLRADSLVFSKPNNQHHIVHSDMQEGIDKLKVYLRTESAINASMASLDLSSEPSTPKRSLQLPHLGMFSAAQLGRCDNVHSWYHSSSSPAHLIASPPLSRQPSGEHCNRDIATFSNTGGDETLLSKQPRGGAARRFGPDEVVAAAAAGMDASEIIALYADNAGLGMVGSSSSQIANIRPAGGRRTPDSVHSGSSDAVCRASSKSATDTGGSYMDDAHVAALLGYFPAESAGDIATSSTLLPETPNTLASKHDARQAEPVLFTAADMEDVHRDYKDKANTQSKVRDKLVQTMRDEFSESAKSQQLKAAQTLQSLRHEHRQQLAALEQELARKMAAEQQRHAREIGQQAAAVQAELDELRGGFASMRAERDDVQAMMEEYVTTSTRLIEQKDEETSGLGRELGRLTLDRHRLQEQLSEATKRCDMITAESSERSARAETLAAENERLEKLAASLRADVLVAEERSAKIKAHAEDMLGKANAEIARLMDLAATAQKELAAAGTRATKADARSKSLQIQLDSTKQQNEELLSLCE